MSNREASGSDAETIIASSVRVEGDFSSQGNVLIEGTVEGSLRTERNLRVGERASISADVFAASASVAGEIKGNLTVSELLELEPTARIHGDIRTKALVVANGAVIDGRISMGQETTKEKGKAARETQAFAAAGPEAMAVKAEGERAVSAVFGK